MSHKVKRDYAAAVLFSGLIAWIVTATPLFSQVVNPGVQIQGNPTIGDCMYFYGTNLIADSGVPCNTSGGIGPLTKQLIVNLNSVSPPASFSGSVIQIQGANASAARYEVVSYGNATTFDGRRANGTGASPSTLPANSVITRLGGLGYDGTSWFTTVTSALELLSLNSWSSSDHSSYSLIVLTPPGSTSNETSAGFAPPSTVSGLTALPSITYLRTYVTDQLTACPVTGTAPTGGGTVICPVFYNGSAWVGD